MRKPLTAYLSEATPALDGCLIYWGDPGVIAKRVLESKLGRALLPTEVVRHTCDVFRCINEEHLVPGSKADNAKDMAQRRRGSAANKTKLSASLRIEMAARFLFGGISRQDLACEYNVSIQLLSNCVSLLRKNPAWNGLMGRY